MIYENQPLMDLIEEGKKNGYIAIKDILALVHEDSEDFDEVSKLLENENIDLVRDEDLEAYGGIENENGNNNEDFDGFIGELDN
ncbi:MAG: RNA polymerase sigma factor region1.1 domain-containing protein, partial [Bacilli bacterium]|nr:RNA polymerase sigma factor region1.1 domain-containing protein [Bacilli bacterium]